ncbi:MAG: cyclic pyranopterin monophosphate synthase MoaC [Candidatus Krumholzibacteriota bacterium]|nr:cyclic pyranopterin monophosphate synthase MoaC [Candidatus Krumholzibacteriota bacterium]
MDFTHIDSEGKARMVDISGKPVQKRTAAASGVIVAGSKVLDLLKAGSLKKGDPLSAARIAGITAAKKTGDLIPLCHPLPLENVDVDFEVGNDRVVIKATAVTTAKTGVEMEALTAVTAAALTIYDMCKAVSKDMVIGEIKLISKRKEEPDE